MIVKKSKKSKVKQHRHISSTDTQNESKKGIIPQYTNVPINISKTRFSIIEECCLELQYKIVDSNSKALIFWCDAGGSFEFTSSLSHFQFCNHFPGTWSLARKVDLARNIGRLNKILPNLYNFHPKSFIIPSQYSELESFMNETKNHKEKIRTNKISTTSKTTNSNISKKESDNSDSFKETQKITFIIKPDKGSFGRGIILIQDPSEVSGYYNTAIAQQYIEPYLIDGLKFDLRIYALVVSIDPLRIYLHREGLARFCTEKYEKPSEGNLELSFAHLTNYALNKSNPNFQQPKDDNGLDKSCHKRSMQVILKQIEEELQEKYKNENKFESSQNMNKIKDKEEHESSGKKGTDEKSESQNKFDLMKDIEDIIRLTVISVQPYISSCYKTAIHIDDEKSRCFEILGFDIMIDESGKPWLLEVNWSPSFADESPFDVTLKKSVIKGALKIVNVPSNFKRIIAAQRKAIASRKPVQPLCNIDEELEIAKKTNYKLIYPLSPDDEKYIDTEMALFESKKTYQRLNNSNSNHHIRIESGKSKSDNSFNLNENKQKIHENQELPKNITSPRGNMSFYPLYQKQAKIIPPIARPNAPIAPRQQHLMSIKSNKSYSQPFFPIQTNNFDESSAFNNSASNPDSSSFYQNQANLNQKRVKSPRRFNQSSPKDEVNEFQHVTTFVNRTPNISSNQHSIQLPTVTPNDSSISNTDIENSVKEEKKSNIEIHQKNFVFSEALPKLITDK